MKKFTELALEERNEIVRMFATWLKPYTHEVIVKVLERKHEIINNELAMMMLTELHKRTEMEAKDFAHSIGNMMYEPATFSKYNPHNHALTHAGSYRDVLYDMYIKD